jgi:hypothetical protein
MTLSIGYFGSVYSTEFCKILNHCHDLYCKNFIVVEENTISEVKEYLTGSVFTARWS